MAASITRIDEPLLSDQSISSQFESGAPNRPTYNPPRSPLHRSKTAPALAVLRHQKNPVLNSNSSSSCSDPQVIRQCAVLVLLYLGLGVLVFGLFPEKFSGVETHPIVDAFYFCIVTMCTIGYGDITPRTPLTKLFACGFVLIGLGFINILLGAAINRVLDSQEKMIIDSKSLLAVDVEKGRMRIRLKVGLALSVVVVSIGIGASLFYFIEGLSLIDSVYLSALSVTTVGYGDRAFSTLTGRLLAGIWLPVSTLAVARAFLYLAEARVDKRQRRIANWILQRDITAHDLLAANINNNDFISKSEYVIYKLKEMGRIEEKDIIDICNQFRRFDPNNSGKITLPDL
ncbi:hypothetical protein V2J09_005065 [Rumex salicifolius]